jgi:hypothetical protein
MRKQNWESIIMSKARVSHALTFLANTFGIHESQFYQRNFAEEKRTDRIIDYTEEFSPFLE